MSSSGAISDHQPHVPRPSWDGPPQTPRRGGRELLEKIICRVLRSPRFRLVSMHARFGRALAYRLTALRTRRCTVSTAATSRGNYGGNHKRQSERQSQEAIRKAIMEAITSGNQKGNHKRQSERQSWSQSQAAMTRGNSGGNHKRRSERHSSTAIKSNQGQSRALIHRNRGQS